MVFSTGTGHLKDGTGISIYIYVYFFKSLKQRDNLRSSSPPETLLDHFLSQEWWFIIGTNMNMLEDLEGTPW